MADKEKRTVFIFQIFEGYLKLLKCTTRDKTKKEFFGLEVFPFSADADIQGNATALAETLKKAGFKNHPLIISLPRSQVACRYLKIPSKVPQEIEKIASLQASHYLPYPSNELITAYQIISFDNEGYSYINLVMAHSNVIERYLKVCMELKPSEINILLSSYGLCNLYNYCHPQETDTTMLIDIDSTQTEVAVTVEDKLLFSRAFKLTNISGWEEAFISEIDKTYEAYKKEVGGATPSRVFVTGAQRLSVSCAEAIKDKLKVPVHSLSFIEKLTLSEGPLSMLQESNFSFAGLIGLGLKEAKGSLSLLPPQLKEKSEKEFKKKEYLRISLSFSLAGLIFLAALFKGLDNKATYLQKLNVELAGIEKETGSLEVIERRLNLMLRSVAKKDTILDMLSEVYKVVTERISLLSLKYEDGKQLILRGQAPEMNDIIVFVSGLEKSPVLGKFTTKIRYATQRKSRQGETFDFEIACLKKR